MSKYKYALVLSGGGFKGAFQAGAINYLRENWQKVTGESAPMSFDIVAGVSVGALNGAMVAMNKIDELNQLWVEVGSNVEVIYTSDFIDTKATGDKVKFSLDINKLKKRLLPKFRIDLDLLKGLGLLFSKGKREQFLNGLLELAVKEAKENLAGFKAIADNTPLFNLLTKNLSLASINSNTKLYCGYVSLTDGSYHCHVHTDYPDDEEFVKGVLASTAMPIVWEPVPLINLKNESATYSVDGGIRNVSPLGDVISVINSDTDNIPYKIFIINCNSGKVEPQKNPEKMNIAEIALRSLNDIAITEIFNNDIEQFILINNLISQARKVNPDLDFKHYDYESNVNTNTSLKYFEYKIIQPDLDVLGDTLVANPELVKKRIEHGWEKASYTFRESV